MPAGLSSVVGISVGAYHLLALKGDGTVVEWGQNNYGQETVPAGLSEVTAIAAGSYHTVALKSDGTVVAWGSNSYSQSRVPVGLSGVTQAGAGHAQGLLPEAECVFDVESSKVDPPEAVDVVCGGVGVAVPQP